jgi:crotonobetainyl-CoA:carnitine CoA-transferase CaiB-like acyl-CoA transferase
VSAGPLAGILVLDLARLLPGPVCTITRAAPAQRAHGIEILREAGLDDAAIETLVRANVVRIGVRG